MVFITTIYIIILMREVQNKGFHPVKYHFLASYINIGICIVVNTVLLKIKIDYHE